MAKAAPRKNTARTEQPQSVLHQLHNQFSHFAQQISHASGQPTTFLLALAVVVVWGVTGPIFNYSDTWQLVINTGTTIVTFLMVFLIQNTQNRDTLAFHLKLSELVFAVKGAKDQYAALETLEDKELEELHVEFCRRAEHMRKTLDARRGAVQQAAARTKPQVKKSRRNGRRAKTGKSS
jgi:low affinity Fe/Cu permease